MNESFNEGDVVIVAHTMQAGTIVKVEKKDIWVLLTCGDFWRGSPRDIRYPQDAADLAACVLEVSRLK